MSDAKEAVAAEVADYARHGSWETLEARLAMRIAAAEERGRRAGIEAHIRDLHAIENALDEFETDPPTALRVVGEHVGMALHNLRALAPRDSGKAGT